MKLYCDDFNNVILEEKVDFIIVDIPYNIAKERILESKGE